MARVLCPRCKEPLEIDDVNEHLKDVHPQPSRLAAEKRLRENPSKPPGARIPKPRVRTGGVWVHFVQGGAPGSGR
jgi:hypothetical protein